MNPGPDSTLSSRLRLLNAAKTLFAQNGYEATSTASIARAAQTSESQLVRYFGGKAGVLEAIFNESWEAINPAIQDRVIGAATGRQAILTVLEILMDSFREDHDLATIFLFEGRRIRGATHEIFISEGFIRFRKLLTTLIQRAKTEASIRPALENNALTTALIGAAEGMIRERLIADRLGQALPFSRDQVAAVMEALLDGLG
ncbi:MAG: TetR/AcrR family transcriptional regulator [Acidobacteria bacterium]|nr:TetR/AcrR family transcriptional regulator [Acidobacteriota bacterium]